MKNRTYKIATCAMLTAVTALLSVIAIPMPSMIPISLQCFAIALCGYFAGSLMGTVSVVVYILIGAVGVPVFAGLRGGFSVLFGATGGFIIGFIPLSLLCGGFGVFGKSGKYRHAVSISVGLVGLLLCHISGIIQFMAVMDTDFMTAFLTASLPYIIKDVICVTVAYPVSDILKKAVRHIHMA